YLEHNLHEAEWGPPQLALLGMKFFRSFRGIAQNHAPLPRLHISLVICNRRSHGGASGESVLKPTVLLFGNRNFTTASQSPDWGLELGKKTSDTIAETLPLCAFGLKSS
ncbi:hypothetical protein AVEN_168121-1, partial [Araneus ventricosus]